MDKREASKKWYDSLDKDEQKKVDKKVKNYQSFVRSRSRTQVSEPGGIELVYAVREWM